VERQCWRTCTHSECCDAVWDTCVVAALSDDERVEVVLADRHSRRSGVVVPALTDAARYAPVTQLRHPRHADRTGTCTQPQSSSTTKFIRHKLPSVLRRCWLGGRKGIRSVKKTERWGAGVVFCLERGAYLHMAQLMPLPLTVSCFRKNPDWFYLSGTGLPG